MGGGGKETTTQNIISEPLPEIKPFISEIVSKGSSALGQVQNLGAFPGPLFAPATPTQEASRAAGVDLVNSSQNIGAPVQNFADSAFNFASNATVPTLQDLDLTGAQGALQSLTDPILQQINEQLIPRLQSDAINQGAFTGSAFTQTIPTIIARDAQREIFNAANSLALGELQSRRDAVPGLINAQAGLAQEAPDLATAGFNANLLPLTVGEQIGSLGQQNQQGLIDEQAALFNEQILAAFRGLPEFASLLGVGDGFGSTNATTVKTSSSDLFSEIFKGLLGVGSAAAGAGAFGSHHSFKENVRETEAVLPKLATLDIPTYDYRKDFVGPMAPDFAERFGGPDDRISIQRLLGVILKGMQELHAEIQELREKI